MLNVTKFTQQLASPLIQSRSTIDGLAPIRQWLSGIKIQDPIVAHLICRVIPARCPFERNLNLFGSISIHIPPLCKLNPLYQELMDLRFRALCYLANECNEDVRCYC
jgi:Mo-dependent nitrogenase C-terminus